MATPSLAFGLPPGVPLDNGKLQTAIPQDAALEAPNESAKIPLLAKLLRILIVPLIMVGSVLPRGVRNWLGIGYDNTNPDWGRLALVGVGVWYAWKNRKRLFR